MQMTHENQISENWIQGGWCARRIPVVFIVVIVKSEKFDAVRFIARIIARIVTRVAVRFGLELELMKVRNDICVVANAVGISLSLEAHFFVAARWYISRIIIVVVKVSG